MAVRDTATRPAAAWVPVAAAEGIVRDEAGFATVAGVHRRDVRAGAAAVDAGDSVSGGLLLRIAGHHVWRAWRRLRCRRHQLQLGRPR
eukprot:2863129-Lingulodinium_polyedra.AAC.1